MILLPLKRTQNYSLPSIEEMEIHGENTDVQSIFAKKQLTFPPDTVLKFLVIIITLPFYHFLVRHNRMLNPCHEVNKLLYYGNKHLRLFNKGECFIRKL